jgi:CRP/FNR family transcriptional regulator, cyclic AMP receptor protein
MQRRCLVERVDRVMEQDRDLMVSFLRGCRSFQGVGVDALRALSYVLRRIELEDEDLLFEEGDTGAEAFIVLEGAVEIIGRSPGGSESVRAVLGAGDLFGELALFGSGRRAAGARARGSTEVAALSYEPFIEIIRAWPDVALALLKVQTERFLKLEQEYRSLLDKG